MTVYLFANGVKINETNLTAENGWKFTFPDLDVYKEGKVINYTIAEVSVGGYTVEITNKTAYLWTVTNTHIPEVTELNVTKVWNDSDNQDGVRPNNVTVYLFANGVKINETNLTAENGWKFTFPDLDVYKEGKVINYSIAEVSVENYTVEITNGTAYLWTVTNTHIPEVTELNVTKIWNDSDNQDGIRPENVTVYLFANGKLINSTNLTEANGWNFTFPDLDVYEGGKVINYTIAEVSVEGYTVLISNGTAYLWTVTNTHIPEVTELNVTKVWNDSDNQDGIRPKNVTVYLFANGVKINETNLTEANGWKFTFPDLDVYKEGKVINYTIAEVSVEGYTVEITNGTAYLWTVTNTHIPEVTELNVTKVWNDSGNRDGLRPSNVTVYLYANGKLINSTNLTEANGWKFTFPDLDVYKEGKVINYTIAEVSVDNYTVAITNGTAYNWTVTNTHISIPNMTVQKIANDEIVYVGNVTSFTIVVTNVGLCNLSGVYVVDDDYSYGLEYIRYENGSRDWTYDGTRWTLVGNLTTDNPTADFTVYFNVISNGTLVNNVTAKSNITNETNGTNKTKAYKPNMTVIKVTLDKEVYVGNTTRFTIVVENTGDCELDKVYVVDTDYDHSALSYIKYENGSRNWTYDGNGNWTLAGPLAVGEKANFTVWFEVLTNGTFINNVTAGSNLTNETNGTNNTTGKPICDLIITKIVNTTHCYVDDMVESAQALL